jgi:hypothetical protein
MNTRKESLQSYPVGHYSKGNIEIVMSRMAALTLLQVAWPLTAFACNISSERCFAIMLSRPASITTSMVHRWN